MKLNMIFMSAFAALLPLTACNGTSKAENDVEKAETTVFSANPDWKVAGTKTLKLRNFDGIKNEYNLEVDYTQGKTYKVVAKYDKIAMTDAEIKVEEGKLVVRSKRSNVGGIHKTGFVRLAITAPSIGSINNSGAFNLNADFMDLGGKNFSFDNNGVGKLDVKTISCSSFDVSNSGEFKHFGSVRAALNAKVGNAGVYKSEGDYEVKGSFGLTNSGSSKITGNILADNVSFYVSGVDKDKVDVNAERLDIKSSGVAKMDVTFKGGDANVECDGVGYVNLDMDCRSFKGSSDGLAKLKLTGTADKTDIDGDGVSKIDASGLNKY